MKGAQHCGEGNLQFWNLDSFLISSNHISNCHILYIVHLRKHCTCEFVSKICFETSIHHDFKPLRKYVSTKLAIISAALRFNIKMNYSKNLGLVKSFTLKKLFFMFDNGRIHFG